MDVATGLFYSENFATSRGRTGWRDDDLIDTNEFAIDNDVEPVLKIWNNKCLLKKKIIW